MNWERRRATREAGNDMVDVAMKDWRGTVRKVEAGGGSPNNWSSVVTDYVDGWEKSGGRENGLALLRSVLG
jgi:hypothetical protein